MERIKFEAKIALINIREEVIYEDPIYDLTCQSKAERLKSRLESTIWKSHQLKRRVLEVLIQSRLREFQFYSLTYGF